MMPIDAHVDPKRREGIARVVIEWLSHYNRSIALGICIVAVLLFVSAMVMNALLILGHAPGGRLDAKGLFFEPGFLVLTILGALIISRWSGQVMGWLFCAIGLNALTGSLCLTYEQFAGVEPLPLLVWALWISQLTSITHLLALLTIVPYLFPDGRLLSPRWRPLLALSIAIVVTLILVDAFGVEMTGVDSRQTNSNPLLMGIVVEFSEIVHPLGFVVIPIAMLGSAASLILRYRRARGTERLQIRWLVWALGLSIFLVLLFLLGTILPSQPINTNDENWTALELTLGLTILVSISMGVPTVLGLAVLRYRLYSIDRIVNRTLVYGSLSVGLAATYGVCVVLLQYALSPLAPGSDLAVAGSTLVVAALVLPLRRHIQGSVDRHFYRQRFDATRTIEAFNANLRDAVDLESLTIDLRNVVQETMQPASVGIWVRPIRWIV